MLDLVNGSGQFVNAGCNLSLSLFKCQAQYIRILLEKQLFRFQCGQCGILFIKKKLPKVLEGVVGAPCLPRNKDGKPREADENQTLLGGKSEFVSRRGECTKPCFVWLTVRKTNWPTLKVMW